MRARTSAACDTTPAPRASFDGAGLDRPIALNVITSIATCLPGGVLPEVQEANGRA